MGIAPGPNRTQFVTIRIPGPIESTEQWEAFKRDAEQLVRNYEITVKPEVEFIANVPRDGPAAHAFEAWKAIARTEGDEQLMKADGAQERLEPGPAAGGVCAY